MNIRFTKPQKGIFCGSVCCYRATIQMNPAMFEAGFIHYTGILVYLMFSTTIDLAGTLTVSTPFFRLASLYSAGAITLGCWKSL